KDKFIEGYISLINKDNTNPDLSIPYMGFYGNFDNESIFDKPIWEEGSKLKSTFLSDSKFSPLGLEGVFYIFGDNSNIKINKENIAISPLENSLNKEVIPAVAVLRNIKELDVAIVDGNSGNETVVRELSNKKNIFRMPLAYLRYSVINTLFDSRWDGKVYDITTGGLKPANDGQYYVRVKGKVFTPNAKDEMLYLPIKIDTVAPEVTVLSREVIENDGNKIMKLNWSASDKGQTQSGIDKKSIRVFVDGKISIEHGLNNNLDYTRVNKEDEITDGGIDGGINELEGGTFEKEDGSYETLVNLESDNLKDVAIALTDGAGNISIANEKVIFNDLVDGAIINSRYLSENGNVELNGFVTNEIEKIIVNGVEGIIDGINFRVKVDLPQGQTTIETVAYNKKNEVKFEKSYNVEVDTIAPEIEFVKSEFISEDAEGNKEYRIYGKLKEEEPNPDEITVIIRGDLHELKSDGTFEGNKIIKVSELNDSIWVAVIDRAENVAIALANIENIKFLVKNAIPVKNGYGISPLVVENGKAFFTGEIDEKAESATLDGIPVEITDGKFSVWVDIKEGMNNVALKIKLKDG
ncbi:MAG: hypothetical protein ACRC68_11980, partial [Clostridium sp.]